MLLWFFDKKCTMFPFPFKNETMKKLISEIEVHDIPPADFSTEVQIAGCYLEIDNKLLLLQSSALKKESGKWGVPAGKLEQSETPVNAAIRELFEETGIRIMASQVQSLGALYIRKPEVDYVYHMFKVQMDYLPSVLLSDEHQNYKWASSEDLEEMPLMAGARDALNRYRKVKGTKRAGAHINAYLVLRRKDEVLLLLRKNTGYCDGMWSFVAGHVEDGESASAAIIREANEEIGIRLSPSQIHAAHVMHRKSDRFNVDVFFDCQSWDGAIQNLEPEKCEKLEFFSLNSLPSNTIDHIKIALHNILNKKFYSEWGWDQ